MESIKAENHLGLVCIVASKYAPKYIPVMDTEEYSDGVFALLKAVEKYNPEKHKTEFSTFAYNCIRKAIIQGWRTRNRKIRSANNGVSLEDDVEQKTKRYSHDDKLHLVARFLENHAEDSDSDRRNKSVLYQHYCLDESWADIARTLGVTRACVQQYGKKALELIRNRFQLENESLIDLIFHD